MAISCSWSNGSFQIRLQYDGTRVPTFFIKYDPTIEYVGKTSWEAVVTQTGAEDLQVMLKAALDQANMNWKKSAERKYPPIKRDWLTGEELVSESVTTASTPSLTKDEDLLFIPDELKGDDDEDTK